MALRYRKKPVVIEAIVWRGDNIRDMEDFLGKDIIVSPTNMLSITTLEGTMKAAPSDWIIKGIKGEFYPCKSDIFEATYELVEE